MKNQLIPSRAGLFKQKGRNLARFDKEQKMIASGSLGLPRLVINTALDLMEKYPGMPYDQAVVAAWGYCDITHNS